MSEQGFTTRAMRPAPDLEGAEPLSVPIYQTATFSFDNPDDLAAVIEAGRDAGYVYTRWHNPTRHAFEEAVAALEHADKAVSFASGMAAITTTLTTLLKAGDHAVFSSDLYGGSFAAANSVLPRWGVETTIAASHRASDLAAAFTDRTRVCYVETIGNPTCSVTDIAATAEVCRAKSIKLVVDATFSTPYLSNPLQLGADVVLHSSTKYMGGHHDMTGGVIAADAATADAIRLTSTELGGTASPFDCWLALRGLATLALRMERHQDNALTLARMLEAQSAVKRVWYPGLASHPDHEVARHVLKGFSGMMAVELAGGMEAGRRFGAALQVARNAASLGGVHTLVIHPASVTHTQLSAADREAAGITDGLVRVSVGIEDVNDLLADFEQALEAAS